MSTPLRVLIIEDSEEDASLLVAHLRQGGFDPAHERVDSAGKLLAALAGPSWDVVLSDYRMPQLSGLDALKLIREKHSDLPCILISGTVGEEFATEAMRLGANDYIAKGSLSRLVPAITRELHAAAARRDYKEIEDEMRLHSAMLMSLSEGVHLTRVDDGTIVFVNPQFERMFGYGKGELIGKHVSVLNAETEKSSQAVSAEIMGHLHRTGTWTGRLQNKRKDGTTFWCRASVSRFSHRKFGQVWISVHQDITKVKQSEELLMESEQRSRLLFEQARDSILLLEVMPQGPPIIRDANNAALRMRGYSREELIGKPITFLDTEANATAVVEKRILLATASGGSLFEVNHRRKDGTVLAAEASVTRFFAGGRHWIIDISRDLTERRRTEMALRESEGKYRALFMSSADGLLAVDIATKKLALANPASCLMFGYSEDEFKNLGLADIHPKDALPEIAAGFDAGAAEKTHGMLNVPCLKKDGTVFYADISGALVTLGGRKHLMGLFRDNTERLRAEGQLRANDSLLKSIVRTSMEGFWLGDTEGRLLEVNDTYCQQSGYSRQELLRMRIADLEAVEKPEEISARIKKIMERGEDRFETRHRRKDGAIWDVEISSQASCDQDGRLIVFLRNVTDRKAAESELARLASFPMLNPNPIVEIDASGRICFLNPAAEGLFPDINELQTAHPWLREWKLNSDKIIREMGLVAVYEISINKRWYQQTIHYIAQDKHFRIYGMDITERKQSLLALENMQRLDSLGILAGGIAHDFNNIFTSILGNISLLQSQMDESHEAMDILHDVKESCATATGLANQLLTFGRGGSPVKKVLDLRQLIKDVVKFSSRGTTARCTFDLGNTPLAADVDKDQVSQVLQNLTINAVQSMPEGGTIKVRAARVALKDMIPPPPLMGAGAGDYIRLTIEDRGIGIQPEHLPKIFDPYFTTKAKGRGLGLAVSHSIMTKHGGIIFAESTPGVKTVFTLLFPAADSAGISRQKATSLPRPGKGRVLIMDDDERVVNALKRILKSLGYQTGSVGNGKAAVAAYKKAMKSDNPFDAVIMDLTIPGGMGGNAAVKKLLELDPKAKVIVSSGYSDDPVLSSYADHGFSAVLPKPYRIEDVSEVLCKVLANL